MEFGLLSEFLSCKPVIKFHGQHQRLSSSDVVDTIVQIAGRPLNNRASVEQCKL